MHGGSCQNLRPGFLCVCGPGHAGDYCQWTKVDSAAYPLTGPVAIVALTLSVIFVGESRAGNWDNPLGFFALSCKLVFILYLNTFFFYFNNYCWIYLLIMNIMNIFPSSFIISLNSF